MLLSLLNKLLKFIPFNGWKAVLGYLGINLSAGQVLVWDAIVDAVNTPSPQTISFAVFQVLMLLGIAHKQIKSRN